VAHDKSIVHRDLKPDNIFLVTDVEGRDQVKVLDFGIAKVLTDSGKPDDLTLTHAGRVCGTPHFMAPEQITLGTVDGRVDLYAIGVSLFQLLTGRRLFPAGSKEHILSKHLYEVPMGIREAAPDAGYSKRLETVIAKCLSKEANMRYQSARSLRKELELFLNGNLPIFDSTTAYDDDETIDRLLPKPDATGAGDLASNSSGSGSEMMIVPPTSSDHTWQKGKVLLVDDSLYLSSQLSELLHERGFEVLLARNGEEGLEQLALHPDVVMCVTDINMPKMDGIQLLQAIRTTPAIAELQVMVMSAANDKSLFRRAQELGVFAWVVKPAHPESIVEAIEQTVDKS
jgi:serine/threonine protein kinase